MLRVHIIDKLSMYTEAAIPYRLCTLQTFLLRNFEHYLFKLQGKYDLIITDSLNRHYLRAAAKVLQVNSRANVTG
jgi:hypothetical protein